MTKKSVLKIIDLLNKLNLNINDVETVKQIQDAILNKIILINNVRKAFMFLNEESFLINKFKKVLKAKKCFQKLKLDMTNNENDTDSPLENSIYINNIISDNPKTFLIKSLNFDKNYLFANNKIFENFSISITHFLKAKATIKDKNNNGYASFSMNDDEQLTFENNISNYAMYIQNDDILFFDKSYFLNIENKNEFTLDQVKAKISYFHQTKTNYLGVAKIDLNNECDELEKEFFILISICLLLLIKLVNNHMSTALSFISLSDKKDFGD